MKRIFRIIVLSLVAQHVHAGHIDFYEKKSQGGTREGTLPDHRKSEINLKKWDGWDNDEIKSFVLRWVTPGTRIQLFDDPKGGKGDDWLEITVKSWQKAIPVRHLEISNNPNNSKAVLEYHKKNGLNGKVSHIKVFPALPHEPPLAARLNLCLQETYEFRKKRGVAEKIKRQGSNYRVRYPDILVKADGTFKASYKVEHIRGGAKKDDYAMVKMEFSQDRMLVDSSTDVTLDDRKLRTDADKIWAGIPKTLQKNQYAVIARVATATASQLYDMSGYYFEHGGRKNFPNVIEEVMNTYGKAIVDCEPILNPPPEFPVVTSTKGKEERQIERIR